MKITKAELKKIIKEELMKEAINPGSLTRSEIQAKIDREKEKFKAAKAAGDERAAFRASQDMGVYMDDLKGALPDSEEGSVDDQDEAKKPNVGAAMEEITSARKTMDWVNKLEAAINNPREQKFAIEDAIKHLRRAMKALETAENTIDSLRKSEDTLDK